MHVVSVNMLWKNLPCAIAYSLFILQIVDKIHGSQPGIKRKAQYVTSTFKQKFRHFKSRVFVLTMPNFCLNQDNNIDCGI